MAYLEHITRNTAVAGVVLELSRPCVTWKWNSKNCWLCIRRFYLHARVSIWQDQYCNPTILTISSKLLTSFTVWPSCQNMGLASLYIVLWGKKYIYRVWLHQTQHGPLKQYTSKGMYTLRLFHTWAKYRAMCGCQNIKMARFPLPKVLRKIIN